MRPVLLGGIVAVVLVTTVLAVIFYPKSDPSARVMTFGNMTVAELRTQRFRVAPALLQVVYTAFGETEEAKIYDGLAEVATGGALEQLYLERVGSMASGGLEPDQTLHGMEFLGLEVNADGSIVTMDAKWRVLGTVGHAEHMHVRGNVYSAALILEPVEGAWKLTGFDLKDVDRSDAGGLQSQEGRLIFDLSKTPTE